MRGGRQREQIVVDKLWDGREGIIPWCCFYDEEKRIVYPLCFSSYNQIEITYPSSEYRTILQVEDISQNIIIHVADKKGEGFLIDKYGNTWQPQGEKVKRFVVVRNQTMIKPALIVLTIPQTGVNKIYAGPISNMSSPFTQLQQKIPQETITFYDISRYKNYVLFLVLQPDIQGKPKTLLFWSRLNIDWGGNFSGFYQGNNPITFPEFFIILPPSNFHFIWENNMLLSDGYYHIYESEIGGYFALLYEKIFPANIPDEFGGGTGFDDIRMGFQVFRNGFAFSIRGITYVFQGKNFDEIRQVGVDTHIAPTSPPVLRRLGMKHTVSPAFAVPEQWKVFITDNYVILLSNEIQQGDQKKRKIYVFEKAEKGNGLLGKCYVSFVGDPTRIKYLRKMSPLRFYEQFIITGQATYFSDIGITPPRFLMLDTSLPNHIVITDHEYEAGQKWIQTRDAGNSFIIEFEVWQGVQALFEFEIDSGR